MPNFYTKKPKKSEREGREDIMFYSKGDDLNVNENDVLHDHDPNSESIRR